MMSYRQSRRGPTLCRDCRYPPRVKVTQQHISWWLRNFPRSEVISLAQTIFGDGDEPSAILASAFQQERKP